MATRNPFLSWRRFLRERRSGSLTLAVAAWLTMAVALTASFLAPTNSQAAGPAFAVLAGITTSSGNGITSLACYGACPGGGTHLANYHNPVDMGAGTTTPPVYLQLDYLPSNDRGGYLFGYRDAISACGEQAYGAPYNGRMVSVEVYHYVNGVYTAWHRESYLHIDPASTVSSYPSGATWWTWNNASAGTPMWASWMEDYKLNNLTSGGMYLGSVTNIETSSSCSDGNHLHQESDSDGQYAPNLYIGMPTIARWHDIHYVTLSGITGSAP